jgi:hypothetical protein
VSKANLGFHFFDRERQHAAMTSIKAYSLLEASTLTLYISVNIEQLE